MRTTLEILARIVNELNERAYEESSCTGIGIRPFRIETCGERIEVKFLTQVVLDDDEIHERNEFAWRKTIEDEAIDILLALREMDIRDPKLDTGCCIETPTPAIT